jgi:micrococcal nuclease
MIDWPFQYRAQLVRVIDGDTVDVVIDKGFGDFSHERLRVMSITGGVNCPELHDPDPTKRAAALAAKKFTGDTLGGWTVDSRVDPDWPLKLVTSKADVFGRYLAVITPNGFNAIDLGTQLLDTGNAVVWKP